MAVCSMCVCMCVCMSGCLCIAIMSAALSGFMWHEKSQQVLFLISCEFLLHFADQVIARLPYWRFLSFRSWLKLIFSSRCFFAWTSCLPLLFFFDLIVKGHGAKCGITSSSPSCGSLPLRLQVQMTDYIAHLMSTFLMASVYLCSVQYSTPYMTFGKSLSEGGCCLPQRSSSFTGVHSVSFIYLTIVHSVRAY